MELGEHAKQRGLIDKMAAPCFSSSGSAALFEATCEVRSSQPIISMTSPLASQVISYKAELNGALGLISA